MKELRYTLITDGPSDDALIPLLTWLLQDLGVVLPILPTWADWSRLPRRPKSLSERIKHGLNLYPCEVLFVHRDAENQLPEQRNKEIQSAVDLLASKDDIPPVIKVVPVRMTEAWVLIDESALRWAASNPNGRMTVDLPRPQELDQIRDPKAVLNQLVRQASGKRGRRLKKLPMSRVSRQIADRIESFAPLRVLSAFQKLEADLFQLIQSERWNAND